MRYLNNLCFFAQNREHHTNFDYFVKIYELFLIFKHALGMDVTQQFYGGPEPPAGISPKLIYDYIPSGYSQY